MIGQLTQKCVMSNIFYRSRLAQKMKFSRLPPPLYKTYCRPESMRVNQTTADLTQKNSFDGQTEREKKCDQNIPSTSLLHCVIGSKISQNDSSLVGFVYVEFIVSIVKLLIILSSVLINPVFFFRFFFNFTFNLLNIEIIYFDSFGIEFLIYLR